MSSIRKTVLCTTSPNGEWELKIEEPTAVAMSFYAIFSYRGQGVMGFPFGYPTDNSNISVRWDLPDNVCGIFIKGNCYALFRYGARRRRRRECYRIGPASSFTTEEIAWICMKKHVQKRRD